jgi:methionine-rich copper-binding protein CopC
MRVTRTLGVVLLTLGLAGSEGSVAWAHGLLESSDPRANSTVGGVPKTVSVALTEAPGPGTSATVSDGCDRNVEVGLQRARKVLEIAIGDAEPGRWEVRFRVISGVDGHATRGKFGFKVRGRADCRQPTPGDSPEDQIGGGEDTQIGNELQDDESDFPIVPFAIGSLVIVGVAFLIRSLSGKPG